MEIEKALVMQLPLKLPWQYSSKVPVKQQKRGYTNLAVNTFSVPIEEKKLWLVEKFEQSLSKPLVTTTTSTEVHVINLHENEQLKAIYPRKSWRQHLLEEHQNDLNKMRGLEPNQDEAVIMALEEYKSEDIGDRIMTRKMEALTKQLEKFDPQASHLHPRSAFNQLLEKHTFSFHQRHRSVLKQQYDSGSIKEVDNNNVIESQADENGVYYCWNRNNTKLNLKAYFIELLPDLPQSLFKTLVWVNLSFNDFFVFPQQLLNAKQIIYLNLRNNPLAEIPEGIKKLKKLRYFNISFCCVSSLHKSLFELSELEILDISYNNVTTIPSDVKNLKHLKELYVDGNFIRFFPFELVRLKLNILHCNGTFINKLFWKESAPRIPQTLTDIVKTFLAKDSRFSDYVQENLKADINSKCDYCSELMPSIGIPVIKPVAELFEHKNLPLLFRVCSQTCRKTLLLASHLPSDK